MVYAKLAGGASDAGRKESAAVAAVRALRKAQEDGYTTSVPLSENSDFRPLSGRPDFKSLEKTVTRK